MSGPLANLDARLTALHGPDWQPAQGFSAIPNPLDPRGWIPDPQLVLDGEVDGHAASRFNQILFSLLELLRRQKDLQARLDALENPTP